MAVAFANKSAAVIDAPLEGERDTRHEDTRRGRLVERRVVQGAGLFADQNPGVALGWNTSARWGWDSPSLISDLRSPIFSRPMRQFA